MSDTYKTTLIRIMGEDYPLKSDADSEYMKQLAEYVEETVRHVTSRIKLPAHLKPEILAALLIADEYFSEKEKNAEIGRRIERLAGVLGETLDREFVG